MVYVIVIVIAVGLFAWGISEYIFRLTHRNPLSSEEIELLAHVRTNKYIKKVYQFKPSNIVPTKEFKSSMNAKGKLYLSDIPLAETPSYIAALLKGKKHEWVVLAFVQEQETIAIWTNKGNDNMSVSPTCSREFMLEYCVNNDCKTIIRLHNHPNSDPQHVTCLLASDQDKRSAEYFSKYFNDNGINWLDFVCEKGDYLEYFNSFSNLFYAPGCDPETIGKLNGCSASQNYRLHKELR